VSSGNAPFGDLLRRADEEEVIGGQGTLMHRGWFSARWTRVEPPCMRTLVSARRNATASRGQAKTLGGTPEKKAHQRERHASV
jgi:hypothetical protein